MLFVCLSPPMFYPSVCFILKQYLLLCMIYLPTLRLRISVMYFPVLLTSIHKTPDFLMLVTCMLINQDWLFDLTRSLFLELSYGIAWDLNSVNFKQNSPIIFCDAWWWEWLFWSLDVNLKNYSLPFIKLWLLWFPFYEFLFNPCKY